MAIRMDIKRTKFYEELSDEKQLEFFKVTNNKFLPAVDNIYYNIFLHDDYTDNPELYEILYDLEELKALAISSRKPQYYDHGLLLDLISAGGGMYRFCLTNPDLYDIFIASHLPNNETPRIHVQLRAYGLWLYGAEKMMEDSYNHVLQLLSDTGSAVMECKENRIDFCYHTNAIQSPEKVFSDRNLKYHSDTNLKKWQQRGDIEKEDNYLLYHKDYFALGSRKSDNVFVRIYNKALEVVQNGYKGFFFELWHQQGLISFYDKYCFEKALEEKNFNYVHKAKLEFYIEYGSNPGLKQEFKDALKYKYATFESIKELANKYMPELTTVMNIEYQTKRKYYSYSDDFIDYVLKLEDKHDNLSGPVKRIFKILDNRSLFIEYLTRASFSYKKKDGSYAAWWQRLRNTKLAGLKIDEKLIRDYSASMDERIVLKKFINTVESNAVYAGNLDTDFVEDLSDIMSNINDNHINDVRNTERAWELARELGLDMIDKSNEQILDLLANPVKELRIGIYRASDGQEIKDFSGFMLGGYTHKKLAKYEKIKNRKKIADAKKTPTKF